MAFSFFFLRVLRPAGYFTQFRCFSDNWRQRCTIFMQKFSYIILFKLELICVIFFLYKNFNQLEYSLRCFHNFTSILRMLYNFTISVWFASSFVLFSSSLRPLKWYLLYFALLRVLWSQKEQLKLNLTSKLILRVF